PRGARCDCACVELALHRERGALAMNGRTRRILAAFLLTCVCTVLGSVTARTAHAQCPPPSMTTANIEDLIAYTHCVKGCGIPDTLPAGDVCKTKAPVIPCDTQVQGQGGGTGTYFANGFDLTRAALAYEAGSKTLYLGFRVAGAI